MDGLNIKMQLLVRSLRQKNIAAKAGVNKSYISNIIAGRDKPSEKVVRAFKSFGIKLNDHNES